ncbi:MAG: M3 family oligoendopeptidase [Ignavibacteria bacterium]|nr:M3 family oligoendopeptidase [Ignavibacteria bacterium]
MRFSEFEYRRPNIEDLERKVKILLFEFWRVEKLKDQIRIIDEINEIRTEFMTMTKFASIKYTIDTTNEFYEGEKKFFDNVTPIFSELLQQFYASLINSKYRTELEKKYGKHFFNIAELAVKTMSKEIIDDLVIENILCREYNKLLASAKIMFDGKERNLAGLRSFMISPERSVRKNSSEAFWGFLSWNCDKLDRIYNDLVKIRHRIAKKLGFENFIELGYARMGRTDYDSKQVSKFRKIIEDQVVPIAKKYKEKQRNRLGLDEFKYYDDGILFKSGNASPKGTEEWIVETVRKVFKELSPDILEFYDFMLKNELMDLHNRKGKAVGGYCSFLYKYKSPFIFANFNGTEDDVRVLIHEAGHGFQAFCSRDFEVPEYISPTLEACEIHSMSMEFLTWPWMDMIFNGDTKKFKYYHLNRSLGFLPYSVSVDEFQHFVYKNPEATAVERKEFWRELENKYLPWKDYNDNQFLKSGGYWQMQRHIYLRPFYYIDYCLAEICAYQFWKKSTDDREKAVEDYVRLCKAGGSDSFLELLKIADLKSPFEEDTLTSILPDIEKYLDSVDEDHLN